MAPQGAQSARQSTQKARKRAPAVGCVGCASDTPKGVFQWTNSPTCKFRRNCSHRDGSEPVRRLRTVSQPLPDPIRGVVSRRELGRTPRSGARCAGYNRQAWEGRSMATKVRLTNVGARSNVVAIGGAGLCATGTALREPDLNRVSPREGGMLRRTLEPVDVLPACQWQLKTAHS